MSIPIPIPSAESGRLAALQKYEILDTAAEAEFDDFTALASHICGTPIALISLVDATRQWFKSRVGLDASETPREIAFCDHVIRGDRMMEVPDAREDARFRHNPLVTGAPDIRFYAGTPLATPDGHNLGTLCVIDRVPRNLSPDQRAALERLGRAVVRQMELRQAGKRLAGLNAQLRHQAARLESANRELSDFAYIVSHDLKAPLRGISTLAGWLAKDSRDKLDEEGREQLDLLQSRVRRLDGLINGILSYSRAGRTREERADVNLDSVVRNIIDLLAPPEHIRIEVETPLPVIEIEPTKVQQLFQNLLSNAIKFMDKPQGHIRVRCAAAGDFWHFQVADNGPGIEEKYFGRIFELFQTLAPRDQVESTGVGLSLVKKIVESGGGRVWVESQPGNGATFHFTLPMRSTAPASPSSDPSEYSV